MKLDLSLQIWANPDQTVVIRVSHDVQGGSAISTDSACLVDALRNLAIAIQNTQVSDPIWKTDLVLGNQEGLIK